MTKARARAPGRTYTISATDEEWEAIRAGAARAGKRISVWAVECALTVDPLPRQSRRLVLDERQQRYISRSMDGLARSLCADGAAPGGLADDLRGLLAARLGAMARQGRRDEALALLRETFGERRAAIVAAAMMPETATESEAAKKPRSGRRRSPRSSSGRNAQKPRRADRGAFPLRAGPGPAAEPDLGNAAVTEKRWSRRSAT